MEGLGAILYPWHNIECHIVGALYEMDTFFVSLIDFSFLHLFFPPSPSLFFFLFFLHWELSPRGLLQAKQAFCLLLPTEPHL